MGLILIQVKNDEIASAIGTGPLCERRAGPLLPLTNTEADVRINGQGLEIKFTTNICITAWWVLHHINDATVALEAPTPSNVNLLHTKVLKRGPIRMPLGIKKNWAAR